MSQPQARAYAAELPLPTPPFAVAVLGDGRVGGSIAVALERAGHSVIARLRRDDDPARIADASVVVIAVPDDALSEAAGVVARLGRPGTVVVHTAGLLGLEPLAGCGPQVAAIHPAVPVATSSSDLTGVPFAITAPEGMRAWCESFVADLGGVGVWVSAEDRPVYHAALVMASNFAVALAGDAADLLGGHELLVPLLRATVDNIAALGPDDALTGPVVRGDAGTVRAHLRALPPHLRDVYIANARRAAARSVAAGRLSLEAAAQVEAALSEETRA